MEDCHPGALTKCHTARQRRRMKVIIATDGHAVSTHAIAEALRLLPLHAAEVTLVSVLDPEERIGGNENAARDLDRAAAQLAAGGVTAATLQRRGHPAEQIVQAATEIGADLIVVGASIKGRIARLLVGGVSTEVMRRWSGAVLVVQHPAPLLED